MLPSPVIQNLSVIVPERSSPYYRDALCLVEFLKTHGGLSPESLTEYYRYVAVDRGGRSWSASTASRKVSAAKYCIRQLIARSPEMSAAQRMAIENELAKLKLPKTVRSNVIGKVLTPTEERRLLGALDKPTALLVRFLLRTGARISEALSIAPGDVRATQNHLEIRLHGKGNKDRIVYYRGELPDFGSIGSRMAVTNRIRRASRKVLGRSISAHCMRHTFATRMIAKTHKIEAVSRYLGHSSPAITMSIYTHEELTFNELWG